MPDQVQGAVTFAIPGKPFGKQRPRATVIRGHARVYPPAETVSFERQVAAIAAPLFPAPLSGALRLTVIATFEPARSLSRRKRDAMLGAPHIQRPDCDNCVKALMDGLNRIAWADDGQVAEISARKQWGTDNGTLVQIEVIG